MRLDALAKANQIADDDETKLHLGTLPFILQRAVAASQSMFEDLKRTDTHTGNRKWAVLEQIRQSVDRRIDMNRPPAVAALDGDAAFGDTLDMDWSALGIDELLVGADAFNDWELKT